MRCHEFDARLHHLLDARRDPEADPTLVEHARLCEGCHRTLVAQRRLFDVLRCAPFPQPTFGWKEHLVAALAAEARRNSLAAPTPAKGSARRLTSKLAISVAILAASVLAVGLATWLARFAQQPDARVLEKQPASASRFQGAAAGRLSRRHLPAVALARRPRDQGHSPAVAPGNLPLEATSLPWHPAELLLEAPRLPARWQQYRPSVDELVVALPQVAQRLDEVDQWAPGLRPLRLSLVRVWEALWPTTTWRHQDTSQPKSQTSDATATDVRLWT